jgi:TolB-like protein
MTSLHQASLDVPASDDQFQSGDVRDELARILSSDGFQATPRRREMLSYLVEEYLAGRSHLLKGYSIGVSVFGRDEDFDPQADPVVRLEARRLRQNLDSYYVSEGRNNPLRISIPKGNYAPEIRRFARSDSIPDNGVSRENSTDGFPESQTADRSIPAGRNRIRIRLSPVQLIAAALVIGLLAAATTFVLTRQNGTQTGVFVSEASPAVMILPFETLGDQPVNSVLSTGIAEQVTTELSKFPDFRIYAPIDGNLQSGSESLIDEGKRLGLSYLLTGSVMSDESTVRIDARLTDVRSGRIIWSENFDEALMPNSLLAVQRDIAIGIASALGQPYGIIRTDLTKKLNTAFEPSMTSYECVLRSYAYRRTFSAELRQPLINCLQKAVQHDPEYAEAWAMLGWLYLDTGRFEQAQNGDVELIYDRALDAASHAVAVDGRNVLALKVLASINHYLGNYITSEGLQRRALELNPNDPDAMAQLGWRLAVRGRFEEGIPYLKKAIRRTVNPPGWYFHLIAVDYYLKGNFAEMLTAAKAGVVDGTAISYSLVAIAQAELGHDEAAREALEKMASVQPWLGRDPAAVYRMHGCTEDIIDAIVAGLRKAGWRESAFAGQKKDSR